MNEIKQIFKYVDLFSEQCSFYVEKAPKLYSVTGGILSIITISISVLTFILISLNDLKRISPSVSFSSTQPDQYHKIKFGKEKIWIPWRIQDYSNNYVNHTNLLYPLIYNYYSIRKVTGTGFEFGVRELNYTLCNNTSFKNKSEIFFIDSEINELYCIEMDDIDIGGDWTGEYISYIEFDLFLCKDGIDYDESNPYCTRYENISHYLGENNSLSMSLYYPVVNFIANKSVNPINIIYRERFYQLSKFSNKIDRIFLQKNILKDNYGWLINKYNESSYWSLSKFEGDSYVTTSERDLMNEGSTSRVYSFNIYLDPTINTYLRTYKKLYIILSECLPFIYFISFVFNMIATICKVHTINKKYSEFLFCNLKEKSDVFDKKIKEIKELKGKELIKIDFNNLSQKKNVSSSKFQFQISDKKDIKDNSLEILNNNKLKDILFSKSNDIKENQINQHTLKAESSEPYNKVVRRKSIKKFTILDEKNMGHKQSFFKSNNKPESYKHFVNQKLFPSRYYLYVIFIKNLDILKKKTCFTKKFAKTYMFITELLDIFSYINLIRQFNVFKTFYLSEKNVNFIEKNRKINIAEISFMKNIKECLDNNNFRIFGKMKEQNQAQ